MGDVISLAGKGPGSGSVRWWLRPAPLLVISQLVGGRYRWASTEHSITEDEWRELRYAVTCRCEWGDGQVATVNRASTDEERWIQD